MLYYNSNIIYKLYTTLCMQRASYLRISCLNSCFIKVDFIFSKGRTIKGHSGIMACLAKDSKVWV